MKDFCRHQHRVNEESEDLEGLLMQYLLAGSTTRAADCPFLFLGMGGTYCGVFQDEDL